MRWTILVIIMVLWLVGFVADVAGGLIHLLLLAAGVILVVISSEIGNTTFSGLRNLELGLPVRVDDCALTNLSSPAFRRPSALVNGNRRLYRIQTSLPVTDTWLFSASSFIGTILFRNGESTMPGTHSSAPEEKSENLVAGADPTDYNVEAIAKLERDALLERNAAERISDRITRIVGSLTFIVVHTALFVVWKVLERAE